MKLGVVVTYVRASGWAQESVTGHVVALWPRFVVVEGEALGVVHHASVDRRKLALGSIQDLPTKEVA